MSDDGKLHLVALLLLLHSPEIFRNTKWKFIPPKGNTIQQKQRLEIGNYWNVCSMFFFDYHVFPW